jgi:hypothetical protein
MLSAKDSEADITFDPETSNPHFSFMEDDGKRHDVWFLDGVTAFNEIHAADAYRPARRAMRCGGLVPRTPQCGQYCNVAMAHRRPKAKASSCTSATSRRRANAISRSTETLA